MVPSARFFHIVRDGRDCAVSAWLHNLRVSPTWAKETFGSLANFAPHFADIWVKKIELARSFAATHPESCLEVRFEELHDDEHGVVRRILQFLDVEASDTLITTCRTAGSFERLAGGRKRGEENSGSHFRKGIVGDWRNHLDDTTLERFHERARPLLTELGYE